MLLTLLLLAISVSQALACFATYSPSPIKSAPKFSRNVYDPRRVGFKLEEVAARENIEFRNDAEPNNNKGYVEPHHKGSPAVDDEGLADSYGLKSGPLELVPEEPNGPRITERFRPANTGPAEASNTGVAKIPAPLLFSNAGGTIKTVAASNVTNRLNFRNPDALKDLCAALPCDFEYDMCAWQLTSPFLESRFKVLQKRLGNRVTGISLPANGAGYLGAKMDKFAETRIETSAHFDQDYTVIFQYYAATVGLEVKGCCDTTYNCPFKTNAYVSSQDRGWKVGTIPCPEGTKKVIFECSSRDKNFGVCGLDDVRLTNQDFSDLCS